MSLRDCINRAVRAGLMDKSRGEWARNLFDETYDQRKLNLGDTEALARAREETLAIIRHSMAQIRREKLLQVSKTRDILEQMRSSGVPIERAAVAVLDFDPGVRGVANVAKRVDSVRGLLHSKLDGLLAKHKRKIGGSPHDKAGLADIVRALHGDKVDNPSAREFAEAYSDTAERARLMFNEAGGDIPKLDGWGLPHSHDAIAVRAQGFDAWYAKILPRLDVPKMRDFSTGQPFDEFSLREAARDAYDGITTEGTAQRSPGTRHGQKLARRRLDHRFFTFKSADDWMQYHDEFGDGDLFSVMMGHLDGMARDIARLQILGPNPTATVRYLADVVEKDVMETASRNGTPTDRPETIARSTRATLEKMYDHLTGSVNAPVHGKAARVFTGVRSVLQSAQLGAAALSAIGDLGFGKMAASKVGIPYRRLLSQTARMFSPTNVEDQRVAVRIGLIADNWATLASGQQRYLGEVSGPEIGRRLADGIMRLSLLSPWTQAGRWAFGMEFSGLMADNMARNFDNLPDELRSTMTRYGITPFEWDQARTAPPYVHKGSSFLRPDDIPEQSVALKFLDMIHTETEFAVPSASVRGRTLLIGESRPGTIQGELMRSFAMYKNFAVTLTMTHLRRGMALPKPKERAKYLGQLAMTLTMMGAVSLQMKELSKGRDPRPMVDSSDPAAMAKFWTAAFLQGGALGIYGDLLFSQKTRYGGGGAETIAGPVAGAFFDVTGTINQTFSRVATGDDPEAARGVVDLMQRYTPGSTLWWTRAALERVVWDQMRRLSDPKADQRIARIEKKYKRDFGQDYWYSRTGGNIRPPDFSKAFGG